MAQDAITVGEAARLASLSVTRVRQLFDSGKLEGIKTPYGRLIFRESILSLIAGRQNNG